ncbi:MAG TPA: ATP-binding protein [Gemmatimonas sp.]|nr:ATP-binding protein [Gemmatimonas sp.]
MTWSRAMVSPSGARIIGALTVTVALLALLGWFADVWWLVQPLAGFAPMRVSSAFGLLALGVGIAATSTPRLRPLAITAALVALLLGTTPLQHAVGADWLTSWFGSITAPRGLDFHGQPPGQIAFASAIFLGLGAIGVFAIVSPHRGVISSILLAASGSVIMLLATTVVLGQILGFLGGAANGPMLGSSLQATVLAIVIATHFNLLAWTKEAGFAPPPAWLPLSVGAGSLVTVLLVWRALLVSEEAQLAERTRLAARATRSAVSREFLLAERTLRRMAGNSVAPDARWMASATQLTDDVRGLESVLWTDGAGRRLGGDARSPRTSPDSIAAALQSRAAQFREATTQATFIPVRGDSSRALMVLPRCAGGGCADLFVGVLHAPQMLDAILADTVLGFEMAIGDRTRWYRASSAPPPTNSRNLVIEPIVAQGPGWQVGVWPSAHTAGATPSTLSNFVLLLGVAVSALLAIALRLAQSVSQSARLDERATMDLALQSTTDGLWEWDVQAGVVTRSPQLWERLGYGAGQQYRGMPDWLEIVHPQDRAMVESRLDDHLASRTDLFDAQYRVRSAAGRWHNFVDRGRVVMRGPGGEPLRLLGMFADVTERRHAEETLRQAETMSTMGRLAARIAHEINNPLAGIQSAFLLIKDAIPADHPHVKYVGAIEREVQRISQVTRQLYETYRPETESSSHAPVQTVVGDAVAFLEQVNRNADVAIDVELGGIAAVVRLSDSLLRQCIYNLVQNAIEASPPGSRVTVSGAIDARDFVLCVRDRGAGVPIEQRERIFDPFVSTKPSKLSTGGMGMGLSLVRRAVDSAGGSIEVTDAEGGGAEFIARIPLVDSHTNGVSA